MIRTTVLGALLASVGFAAAPLRSAPFEHATGPLLPLTYDDEKSTSETGCTSIFHVGTRDYLQLVGTGLTLRDPSGFRLCGLTEEGVQAFEAGRGSVVCSRYGLRIRTIGRPTTDAASDSSSRTADLIIYRGGMTATMRGRWSVAC